MFVCLGDLSWLLCVDHFVFADGVACGIAGFVVNQVWIAFCCFCGLFVLCVFV